MSIEWTQEPEDISVTSIPSSIDVGYSYSAYEQVSGKSAAEILKQVDKILQSTNVLLENHKEYLPEHQFTEFKKAYRRQVMYHWQMTNESQEDRAYYDQRIRESRILSQLYANKQSHHDRAKKLLREVESYQTKVLSASRNAQPPDTLVLFEDELTPASSSNSRSSTLDSYTSWFSFFGRQTHSSSVDSEPAPISDAEGQGFTVSVTYFPAPPSENVESTGSDIDHPTHANKGGKTYQRMIAFEDKDRRTEVTDPKFYKLEENQTYIAEDALQALLELGQRVLDQSDSGIHQVSQITDSPSQTPSLEATIQKFRKMSVAKD
ncbi:unnamed protein product [Rhizoctonia solani]|uniref:Uncharacterized protein n=1 Tax=Rhizoctonia solani TaxID=456999 RepID=A0A8H3AHR2_9AGAM|nr:unnamed protein product [Rhizoctonia solani]